MLTCCFSYALGGDPEWFLMRLPDYEETDFWSGYAIGQIKDDFMKFVD